MDLSLGYCPLFGIVIVEGVVNGLLDVDGGRILAGLLLDAEDGPGMGEVDVLTFCWRFFCDDNRSLRAFSAI